MSSSPQHDAQLVDKPHSSPTQQAMESGPRLPLEQCKRPGARPTSLRREGGRGRRGSELGPRPGALSLSDALLMLSDLAEATWYSRYAELHPSSRAARMLRALDALVARGALGSLLVPRDAFEAVWLRCSEALSRRLVFGHLVLDLRNRIDLWSSEARRVLATAAADLAERFLLPRSGLTIAAFWDGREHCIHLPVAAPSREDIERLARELGNVLGVRVRHREVESAQHIVNMVLYLAANHRHIYVPGAPRSTERGEEYAIELIPNPRIIAKAQNLVRAGWARLHIANGKILLVSTLRLLLHLCLPALAREAQRLALRWKPQIHHPHTAYNSDANRDKTETTPRNPGRAAEAFSSQGYGDGIVPLTIFVNCLGPPTVT